MKRFIRLTTLLVLLVLVSYGPVFSQTTVNTTLTHNFTVPDTGVFYCWFKGYKFIYQNDEAKIVVKSDPAPDRFVIWVAPFKLKGNPWCSFRMKATKPLSANMTVKDHGDGAGGAQDQVDKPFTVPGDSTYRTYFFDLTADLGTLTYNIDEIQFSPGAVNNASIWVDDFKMGVAAKPAYNKPNIDQALNIAVPTNSLQQDVKLTGINDGSGGILSLTVAAASDNLALIPNPTILWTSPHDTAHLQFTPTAGLKGSANITVTVTSSAPLNNVKTMKFLVIVNDGGGTGFSTDFNSGSLDTIWKGNSEYILSQSGGLLHVSCNKLSPWRAFNLEFGKIFDFSSSPYVDLKLNTDVPFIIYVYLMDAFGGNALVPMRIFPVTNLTNYCFDFTNATGVNLSAITGMIFAFNGPANGFVGNAVFDDLLAGSSAIRFANIAAISDKEYYKNFSSKSFLLTDIAGASSITATGTGHVLKNLAVGSVGADTARFSFGAITDATGKDTVTLSVSGASGYQSNSISFLVGVSGNNPPTIDSIPDMDVKVGVNTTINLTGISDGDPTIKQNISVSSLNGVVNYTSDDNHGTLTINILTPGVYPVSAIVSDGITKDTAWFNVNAYASLNNPPVVDPIADVRYFFGSGAVNVPLTGLADGDGTNQALTITAVSSDTSIVQNPVTVNYTSGATGSLIFTPSSVKKGLTTITLTVTDNGGTAQNNGNKTSTATFKVSTGQAPITGYVVPMTDYITDSINKVWGPEAWGTQFKIAYVDSGSFKAMKIDMKDKWDYGGIWMQLPVELDLTAHPQLSFDVYSVDTTTYHWNYLYDDGTDGAASRNTQNTASFTFPVTKNKWTHLSYDYSNPGDLNNDQGNPIHIDRINAVLFNLHYKAGAWPFTNFTGTVYYRDIRIGDKAIVPVKEYPCSLNGVSDMGAFVNAGNIHVNLTGISDGQDSTQNVTLSAKSSNTSLIPTPILGTINIDGTADLSFAVGANDGTALITVTASAPGSVDKVISFRVNVTSSQAQDASKVNIDLSQKFQTIEGLGTFQTATFNADYYLDMGSSGMRLGVISNHVEEVNDNDDPFVLNMAALNHNAFDWNYLKKLKDNGVEKFILTLWSPPAWMKESLSYALVEQAIEWENTQNKVLPYMYDEYAENVVATIRLIKEEAGIDIYAVCPQNEPAFNEPYESAILGPAQFVNFIKVLGPRLQAEGLNTKIYMPEQVYGIGFYSMYDYITALNADPIANQYVDIVAVHGYAADGITPGIPDFSGWKYLFDASQAGTHPKQLWMTETFLQYNGFTDAMKVAGAIHGGLRYGNISWWTNWAFEGVQITKNLPNSAFYTTKNYFKYVRPGAVRVGSSSTNPDIMEVAFYHPVNKTYTIILLNKAASANSVQITGNNIPGKFKAFRTTAFENFVEIDSVKNSIFLLPANSVTTLYSTENSILAINAVADQYIEHNAGPQQVALSGIDNGSGSTNGLNISVKSDNPVLIPDISVGTINADGTANLNYTPAADQNGDAKVTLTLSDGVGNTRELVFYIITGPTGIKTDAATQLNIYPNPAADFFNIVIPAGSFSSLTITDLTGKLVYQQEIHSLEMTVNTSGLDKGLYFVKINGNNKSIVSKLIIQ